MSHPRQPAIWFSDEPPPKPRLSRERIVAAAVELLDAEGVSGFSMRRLAARVEAGVMSLYAHVSSREHVLDLAYDQVVAELPAPAPPPAERAPAAERDPVARTPAAERAPDAPGQAVRAPAAGEPAARGQDTPPGAAGWRATLTRQLTGSRQLMRRHPWAAALAATRPLLGPNSLARSEEFYAQLARAGLRGPALLAAVGTLTSYTQGFVANENIWRDLIHDPADETELRRRAAAFVASRADSHPALAEHAQLHIDDFDAQYALGLEIILDGVEAQAAAARRGRRAPSPPPATALPCGAPTSGDSVRTMPNDPAQPATPIPPVTPGASAAARGLLDLLYRVSGETTLSGQHNQPIHGSAWTERITGITDRVPAVWGQEIGFSAPGTLDGVDRRAANVEEAVAWHRRGAVITYTWHSVCPADDEPVEFKGGIIRDFPPAEFDAVLDPGSALHTRWCAQVDAAAAVLRQLGDADVPVLWRPYHEMNGPWFWWGAQPERLVALWRQLFDRLVNHHELRNLIWVWSPNAAYDSATPFAPYYPGHDVVDVLAMDTYGGHYEPEHHARLRELADGRPLGLGEIGDLPPAEVLTEQPDWTWFMAWPDVVTDRNSDEAIRAFFQHPRISNLPDVAAWRVD